ncbi:hypothetical protein Belba_3773 [Belliella baltica DSM 15883]|uniref:Uncharacterized protein n=1 Tax=Belliella baltica (strain DSM 15883 / CIP 108006 / LMG 21964 / BA134) TaxID=866536 RepID=I3ZAI8_BELBD|nr:hypothetical protein [Belliella baltica]AFL86256.1 hypothetical protein Belba_3773 [Belliella baltica DSM 15883]
MKVETDSEFLIPNDLLAKHYCSSLPSNFPENLSKGAGSVMCNPNQAPSLFSAHLPEVLDWLHGMDIPKGLEENPCQIPVLLFDKELTMEHLLFHYDGTPASAQLIFNFINLFKNTIKGSKATIISPSFIPKSKLREEQEIIQAVSNATFETSFIKFNFSRIGDFWSYAVKHKCTLLVTSKNYQADLAKVLFHFYKGGMWYNRLSFYLSF